MPCAVCGSTRCTVFYNKRISEQMNGVREKVTICEYCKTMEVKKEVG